MRVRLHLGFKSLLVGHRPTYGGQHIYHAKVDGDLACDRQRRINSEILEDLRFNILIREDVKA